MFDLVPFKFTGLERNFWPSLFEEDFLAKGLTTFKADISETEGHYTIEAELPGYTKDELGIEVNHNHLTISARKNESNETKEGNYLRRERRIGQVTRTFVLKTST